MKHIRRWLLDTTRPYVPVLAADSRLSATDYTDDQVWSLDVGQQDESALTLRTHYGGRVGLASIVPLWTHDGRLIYETGAYAHPPTITGFAPGYLRLQASLTLQLALQAEYWVIDSHTLGMQFTLSNARVEPTEVRLDLYGHVGAQGRELDLYVLPVSAGHHALQFGQIGDLHPVLLLENGSAQMVDGVVSSPKIGHTVTIAGRKKVVLRAVHTALGSDADSLAQAQHWLAQDWKKAFRQIDRAAQAIPQIETGDEDLDLTLAWSYHQLLLAFLRPTSSLPHHSIVALRASDTGYSRRGDGTDYRREWSGQSPTLSYLHGLAVAPVNAGLAQGLVRNYLAVQQENGWIDWKPGLGGQRQGILCLPVLARLAWGIFQYTEDAGFLKEVFPGLLKFFSCWLDQDADGDGLPEWQSENQTGYVFMPTFAAGQAWGQHLDIRKVETPDLMAYLLSEAISLRAIAYYFHDSANEAKLDDHIAQLQAGLQALWDEQAQRYQYRDRDQHHTQASTTLLVDGRGDEEHILAIKLSAPARVIVEVEGGVNHTPRLQLRIEGLDAQGAAISEETDAKGFVWQHNRGAYTTDALFAQVDRIQCEGLSRVYRLNARTPDTTRLDINALLPLWAVNIPPAQAEALVQMATDERLFWQPNGVTMCAATDPQFDPANARGAGGSWPFWVNLVGEGLLESGHYAEATDLLKRLLAVQTHSLRANRSFSEFYHSAEPAGLGVPQHLGGIAPLHLLLRVLGVRIISPRKVWTGGPHTWGDPVTITQHGVKVTRSAQGTTITFPSGYETVIEPNAEWQEIVDTQPKSTTET